MLDNRNQTNLISQQRADVRVGRQRRPTMNDVANLAGVGVKTVSRVVNGEAGVSTQLAGKVEKAIADLGYLHNFGASSLRRVGQATSTVGLVVGDIGNPFTSLLQRSVEQACRERGLLLLVSASDGLPEREKVVVRELFSRRVDGLIIVPAGQDHAYLASEVHRGTPVVLMDSTSPGLPLADTVVANNSVAGETATRHLLSYGHRRIAHFGDLTTIETARLRYGGYVAALQAANIPLDPALVRLNLNSPEDAMGAIRDVLSIANPPTAIFSGQNMVSISAVRVLRELGLHNSVALVGFDDFSLADLLEPAISVLAQDPIVMGQRAAEILFRRIDGFDGAPEHITIGTTFIQRGSGEIPCLQL